MDYTQPRVSSANLSRAYATLRRLDVLRAQDIIQPVAVPPHVQPRTVTAHTAGIPEPLPPPPRPPTSLNTTQAPYGSYVENSTRAAAPRPSTYGSTFDVRDDTTRPVAHVAAAAAPPRYPPLPSPTPNSSLLDNASRLTHPTTLASSSFLSAGTPLATTLDVAHTHTHARSTSTGAAAAGSPVSAQRYAPHAAAPSPSPRVESVHRYRPRRGLAAFGDGATAMRAACNAASPASRARPVVITSRDRVGDYRGREWDDDAATAAAAETSSTQAAAHAASNAGDDEQDGFFDQDPALQATVAITRGGFQPLSIVRESADRVDEEGPRSGEAQRTGAVSQAALSLPRTGRDSPLLSTQDYHAQQPRRFTPTQGEKETSARGPLRRSLPPPTPPPSSGMPLSQATWTVGHTDGDEESARRRTRDVSDDASSISRPDSRSSNSNSSGSSTSEMAVLPRFSERPFARVGPRPVAPDTGATTATTATATTAAPPKPSVVAPSPRPVDELPPPPPPPPAAPRSEESLNTAAIAAAHAARLVETYRARQAQLRERLETAHAPPASPPAAESNHSNHSSSSSGPSASADATVDVGDVTRVGEAAPTPPADLSQAATIATAPADDEDDTGEATPEIPLSPLRAPSVVSYKDYLVQSPRPRSNTASHPRPAEDDDDEDYDDDYDDDADGSVTGASEDSPPRLTASSSRARSTNTSTAVAVSAHARSLHSHRGRCGQTHDETETTASHHEDDLTAYVEAIHGADADTLAEVLASMAQRDSSHQGEADADPQELARYEATLFTEDCLGLTVLLNKPAVVTGLIVPWLMEELEQTRTASASSKDDSNTTTKSDRRAHRIALLCALAGFGSLAASSWSLLQSLLTDLTRTRATPEKRADRDAADEQDDDELALVLLTMRATGGEKAIDYLRMCLGARQVSPALRCAAAYGLGTMGLDVVGHTTALCVPLTTSTDAAGAATAPLVLYAPDEIRAASASGSAEGRARADGGAFFSPSFADDDRRAADDAESSRFYREVQPTAPARRARAPKTTALSVLASPALQRPPPYMPTNILVDVRRARAALQHVVEAHPETLAAAPHDHAQLGVVLHDFVEPDVAAAVRDARQHQRTLITIAPSPTSPSSSSADGTVATDVARGQALVRAGLSEVLATIDATWREPVLPFSYASHVVRNNHALLFDVERTLLNASLGAFATPTRVAPLNVSEAALQEAAALALASLPSDARQHVAQPLMEYVAHMASTAPALAGTSLPTTIGTVFSQATDADEEVTQPQQQQQQQQQQSGGAVNMAQEGAHREGSRALSSATESAFSAAVLALGCVATPAAASPELMRRTATLLCALVRHSPSPRVRHGAMAGLGFLATSWLSATCAVPDRAGEEDRPFRRVLPVLLRLCTVCLLDGCVSAQTVAWTCACGGPAGARHLLHLLRTGGVPTAVTEGHAEERIISRRGERATPRLTTHAQLACVQALLTVPFTCPSALLDELIDTLGTLAISQGIVDEDVQRACVRGIARTVFVASSSSSSSSPLSLEAPSPASRGWLVSTSSADGALATPGTVDPFTEVFDYYATVAPSETFKVVRSILESSTVPYGVLCEVFRCLCAYGGPHGELYASQTCMESTITAARAAAAYGLRGAGARAVRVLALALNDDDAEVRHEAESTVNAIGVEAIVEVLAHRPTEQREQVTAALRDCLLRDVGRGRTHLVLEDLYAVLNHHD